MLHYEEEDTPLAHMNLTMRCSNRYDKGAFVWFSCACENWALSEVSTARSRGRNCFKLTARTTFHERCPSEIAIFQANTLDYWQNRFGWVARVFSSVGRTRPLENQARRNSHNRLTASEGRHDSSRRCCDSDVCILKTRIHPKRIRTLGKSVIHTTGMPLLKTRG
jgi:hypothetical protein